MNELKLRGKIAENGYTVTGFAKTLGMNPTTVFRKLENNGSFDRAELQAIRRSLKLTDDEFLGIFFSG